MTPAEREAGKIVDRAWDWFAAMVQLSATNLGIDLGIFDALRSRPLTPEEIAARLGLVPRAVDLWAKTLVHYELLADAGDGRVAMPPGLEIVVNEPSSVYHLAPSIQFHARFLARDFLDLADFFHDGVARPPARHGAALAANILQQTAAMHAVFMRAVLPELWWLIEILLRGGRVLDVGCGAGGLGIDLCETFPMARYVGYDPDESLIAAGRQTAAERGLADRITLNASRFPPPEAPPKSDVAFLFLALHEIAPSQRPDVLSGIRESLVPGAPLVIFDEWYPETVSEAARRESRMGLHFEYSELVWGSRVASRSEAEALLSDAGFAAIEWVPMLGDSLELVVARTA